MADNRDIKLRPHVIEVRKTGFSFNCHNCGMHCEDLLEINLYRKGVPQQKTGYNLCEKCALDWCDQFAKIREQIVTAKVKGAENA